MSINYLFMIKEMLEAAHSNRIFTLIVEEAMEWKWCEKEEANKKKARRNIQPTT